MEAILTLLPILFLAALLAVFWVVIYFIFKKLLSNTFVSKSRLEETERKVRDLSKELELLKEVK
ncbi:hypothetical protein [Halalkalibacter hemicellulosilyticus]|uniref:DUF4083 domain-containing protein n=1 Tax=Halalkalibacter hemicellulosilyticusJCM 9152 TaxID=1236971 RepID=W4QEM2_9BACI|nr:hypothetical protein [Halalkalibacter hemicellulosilyticus]GAE30496.1 hypothetical protein JCM9152_1904 [Halalkalibacter hemicellulosilyticusJCM 9152]